MADITNKRPDQGIAPASNDTKYRFDLARWIIIFVFSST